MKRCLLSIAMLASLGSPALSQEAAVRPTRYLHPISLGGVRAAYPSVEHARTLEPREFVLDVGAFPSVGGFLGVAANLEIGFEVGGSSIDTGAPTMSDAALTGKYRLLANDSFSLAILASARYAGGLLNVGGPGWTTNYWIGLPVTFGSVEGLSFDVMPIAEVGPSGSLSAPPGVTFGLKIPLAPSLYALIGDYAGAGLTQTVTAGLRYELGPRATLDLNLIDYKFNTGSTGLQIGTLGIVGYFGGGGQ